MAISLGGQVAGSTGKAVGGNLSQISALDPAGKAKMNMQLKEQDCV